MTIELKTRLVFVDTEVFRSKNYQFGEHTLKQLEEHLEYNRLHLLLSSITVNEIKSQIRERSNDAHSKLKIFQRDAMFLRNAPDLPCYQIFQKVNVDQIYEQAVGRFNSFLDNEQVEIVTFEGVKIENIFEMYFLSNAPFGSGKKKSEFPDAFAIEAVVKAAERRQHELYIISNDQDLKNYAEQYKNLHHLHTIEELLDLVVRTEEVLVEPAKIGDQFIADNIEDMTSTITDKMRDSEFYADNSEGIDIEVTGIDIKSVKIESYKIINATRDEATYEIEFSAQILAEFTYSDYDGSPWDPEDREYVFVVQHSFARIHDERYVCFLSIDFTDGLPVNAAISEITFESSGFDLNDANGTIIKSQH
ncbi:MAG: hypothetical protein EOO53_14045 [Gammaproteobacteria bacterium]|nr:MAG: hypothetical protein EOO53_14045 [Gammaproteobacteria bacterium]